MWKKDSSLAVAALASLGLLCGAGFGYLVTHEVAGVVSASVGCGAGAGFGAFLRLRRDRQRQAEAMRAGFGAGLAQGALIAAACYHRAAFPRTGKGAVSAEEVAGLRWVAFQQAAEEELATPVREAAARLLEAVDRGAQTAADSLLLDLMHVVHEQHCSAPVTRSARR
ncbi:hypothetical protein [Streptomyces sp. NRRL S-920]|uniref:hypothetical protein n=1 Tax=Streptomyces sp. NRRL S-920 TaxID=1463921 RepID=UPI00068D3D83|nr:hypothetical protein [Streptomyces sp. NRRL S-920]